VAISDIALKQPLPESIRNDVMAYVGCIAGAVAVEDYQDGLAAAGISQVQIIDSGADLNAYAQIDGQSGCCSPAMTSDESSCGEPAIVHLELGKVIEQIDLNAYAGSVRIYGVKAAPRLG
jgi:hypothetical protein